MAHPTTLLVFPPFWEPTQPYLSLPALVAWLRQQGYSASQWDLNLEFHDTVISTAWFEHLYDTRCTPLVAKALPIEQVRSEFLPRIDQAKAILRSPQYYEPTAFIEAKSTLERAYELLSLFYYPTQCSRNALLMPYRDSSSSQVMAASRDDRVNPYLEFYQKIILPRIAEAPPDLLGFSIADTTQLVAAMTLARLVRERFPETHITAGGALFSKFAEALKNQPDPVLSEALHSMVRGEGELPLLKLVQALEGQHTLAEVPGLLWRSPDGQMHLNEPGIPIPMNDLPAPDFDGLPLARYWAPQLILPMLASKDCYWKDCAFCDHYVSYAPRYRLRKPALIAQDMAALQARYGTHLFSFGDETMSPNYARHLSQALINQGTSVHWTMLSRLQKGFDPPTCALIRQGGGMFIMFGLESAHPRVIELMAKGTDVETALEVYRNTDAAGIFNYSFIFFGFPTETPEEAQVTVDFVTQNQALIHSIGAGHFFLQKYSPMFRQPRKYGIAYLHDQDLLDDWTISVGYEPLTGMNQAEASHFHKRFMAHLQDIYKLPLWLVDNNRSTLTLYLDHYGPEWMKTFSYAGMVRVRVA